MKPYKPFFAQVGVTHHLASKMPKFQHRIAKASWISPKGFFINMPKEHRLLIHN